MKDDFEDFMKDFSMRASIFVVLAISPFVLIVFLMWVASSNDSLPKADTFQPTTVVVQGVKIDEYGDKFCVIHTTSNAKLDSILYGYLTQKDLIATSVSYEVPEGSFRICLSKPVHGNTTSESTK